MSEKRRNQSGGASSFDSDGTPIHLSEDQFDEFVRANRVCVVDFWAEWCAPCRFLEPIVEEIARENRGKAAFGKLNVDDNPRIAERYEIMSIPTLLVFKDGQPVHMIVGAMPKSKLLEQLKPFLE